MTVKRVATTPSYIGLAADAKPTSVQPGSRYYAYDTGVWYVTYDDGSNWVSTQDDAVSLDTTAQGLLGALTETAPATDTASSGLNGRLQRIAQRLSTLVTGVVLAAGTAIIGKVGIDQTTPGTTDHVTGETKAYTAPVSGELQGSASALQLPNIACKLVRFKAEYDNAGRVYLGGSGVTKADGTTDATTGLQLNAGEDTGWIPVDNLNRFYRICDNAGDDLTYLALA